MLQIEVDMTFWTEYSTTTFLTTLAKIVDHNNAKKRSKIFYGKIVQNKSEVEFLSRIFLMLLLKNYLISKNHSLEKKCSIFLRNCKADTRKINFL